MVGLYSPKIRQSLKQIHLVVAFRVPIVTFHNLQHVAGLQLQPGRFMFAWHDLCEFTGCEDSIKMNYKKIGFVGRNTAMAMSGAIPMVTGIVLLLGVVHGIAGTGDSGPVQGLELLASLAGEWKVSGTM